MHVAILFVEPIDRAARAHVEALAHALRRRGDEVRELDVPGSPGALDDLVRAIAPRIDIAWACTGAGPLPRWVEERVLAMGRSGTLVGRIDTAPEALVATAATGVAAGAGELCAYHAVAALSGEPGVAEVYRALGARRAVAIPPALDPTTFYPSRPRRADVCDVLAILPRSREAEAAIARFVIEPARRLPERRFALAGDGWADLERPPNVVALPAAAAPERNALYAATRFYLEPADADGPPAGAGECGSIFEAAGAGACVIGPIGQGLERTLVPGESCLVVRCADDVVRAVSVVTRALAREVGRRGRARVLERHTYAARARALSLAAEEAMAEAHERRRPARSGRQQVARESQSAV